MMIWIPTRKLNVYVSYRIRQAHCSNKKLSCLLLWTASKGWSKSLWLISCTAWLVIGLICSGCKPRRLKIDDGVTTLIFSCIAGMGPQGEGTMQYSVKAWL